ncbi:MAG TPA: CDP-alcohol phosphatidyltransferase family protein [Steroidobacteraceae bacterium]
MSELPQVSPKLARPSQWDARLARRLVLPLKDSPVTPNDLTTLRLATGLAAALAFIPGSYGWSNIAALLLVVSNFIDHADGELARISDKASRLGHLYDLASDTLVTVLLFVAMGVGVRAKGGLPLDIPPVVLGAIAGSAIALIFFLRMRIEEMAGKAASRQRAFGGFETEDVLYLLPLATLCDGVAPLLLAASVGAPLFAVRVVLDYQRLLRRPKSAAQSTSDAGLA